MTPRPRLRVAAAWRTAWKTVTLRASMCGQHASTLPPTATLYSCIMSQPGEIPLSIPFLGDEEIRAASRAIREAALGGGGRYGRDVEDRLRTMTGSPHAFLVTSGTHATELALMVMGVGPGDEVVMPSFTFASAATAVLRQGARPVFVDIDPQTWNLDPEDVARSVGPRTRAIMPVHYGGNVASMKELATVARPPCVIIEDAAHAFGASYLGRAAGTFGDAGCYSFHATKNVTCGEGGALLLRDTEAARRAEMMRDKGTDRQAFLRGEVARYTWRTEGSSFVTSDLLAAVLLEQLEKARDIHARRRDRWHRYADRLRPLARKGHLTLPVISPDVESSYHIFAVLVDPHRRDAIRTGLRQEGIEAASHYVPLHASPYWTRATGNRQRPLPVTDRVSESLLRLPLYPTLTWAQQDRVIDALFGCFPA